MRKLESLKNFELANEESSNTKGGRIYWTKEGPGHESFSIGTYVDGMSMGTDGHED